jgi:hypothetical protein
LRDFHEVESAGGDVLQDPAEVRLLARLRLARVDAVVVLAGLVGRAVVVVLAFTLKSPSQDIFEIVVSIFRGFFEDDDAGSPFSKYMTFQVDIRNRANRKYG